MDTLIHAGRVISAVAGQAPSEHQGILVRDGVIAAIDTWGQFTADEGVQVIDASHATLLPGLIDAHTHIVNSGEPGEPSQFSAITELPATTAFKAAALARRQIAMGVTTIRDVGARDWVDIALRDAIEAGLTEGPRILACGHGITSPGGHMDARKLVRPELAAAIEGSMGVMVGSADEARRAAWEQLMRGADLIKINATLSEYVRAKGGTCSAEMTFDMMKAICDVAHSTMRKVAAHCHGGPGVDAAIEAGVDTFEHGRFMTDSQLEQLASRGRFLVPTLSPEARRIELGDEPRDPGTRRWTAMASEVMYKTVARAYELGVPVVAGTDAGMPHVRHGDLAFEMWHLGHAGLPAMAVIESATRVAALALGMEDSIGQIRPGYTADLIAVDGDPLDDLALLQRAECIHMVMQGGRVSIDRMQPKPIAA